MLNCCIERKKAREAHHNSSTDLKSPRKSKSNTVNSPATHGWDWDKTPSESSEEEFFECPDEEYEPIENFETKLENSNKPIETVNTSSASQSDSVLQTSSKNTTNKNSSQSKELKSESCSSVHDSESQDTDVSFTETWTHQPEGRRAQYLNMTLLGHPTEPLYIPLTQEPAPMTEDMLEEQAEVLSK
jgi:hypothetical protein